MQRFYCDVCDKPLNNSAICHYCHFDNSYQFDGNKIDILILEYIKTYAELDEEQLFLAVKEKFGLQSGTARRIMADYFDNFDLVIEDE